MNRYEYSAQIDGKWIDLYIDLDELRTLALKAQAALVATGNAQGVSKTTIQHSTSTVKTYGGWKVVMSNRNGWASVRNFDKRGNHISALKYEAVLEAAGIKTKVIGGKDLQLLVEPKIAVAA